MKNVLKQLLSIILAIVITVGVIPVGVFAVDSEETTAAETSVETEEVVEESSVDATSLSDNESAEPFATVPNAEDYSFEEKEDGTIEITKYNGDDYIVAVPAEINEKAVTSIGANALKDNENIIEIMIPDGIKTIGENAFSNCSELYSVLISPTVETIAENAFADSEATKILCYYNTAAYTYAKDKAMKYFRIYDSTVVEDGGECGTQANWHLNLVTGMFIIYGTVMPNYN